MNPILTIVAVAALMLSSPLAVAEDVASDAPAAPASVVKCAEDFSRFDSLAKTTAEALETRVQFQRYPKMVQTVHNVRDSLRKWLQRKHVHPYTVVAVEDNSALKAYGFAKGAFGETPAEFTNLFNPEEVKNEILQILNDVEKYPVNLQNFIDDTATQAAREQWLQEVLDKGMIPPSGKTIPVPQAKVDLVKGTTEITSTEEFFGTPEMVGIELDKARAAIRSRLNPKFLTGGETSDLVLDEAIKIKRLETVLKELKRQESIQKRTNPDAKLPDEYQQIVQRILALYKDPDKLILQDNQKIPAWAWNKLKWANFRAEATAVFQKDLPGLKDKEQAKKILNFVNQLSDEDKRALGLTRVAEDVTILRRTRLGMVATAALGLTTPGGLTTWEVWNLFIKDSSSKEGCAGQPDDNSYINCAQTYLKDKFGVKYVLAKEGLKNLIDAKGDISDPAILKEVDDLRERRRNFLVRQNMERDLDGAIRERAKTSSPEAEREKAVYAETDVEFMERILGSQKTPSYIRMLYPSNRFDIAKPKIEEILKAEDVDTREKLLSDLRLKFNDIADDLLSLIEDHNDFVGPNPIKASVYRQFRSTTRRRFVPQNNNTNTSNNQDTPPWLLDNTNTGPAPTTGGGMKVFGK